MISDKELASVGYHVTIMCWDSLVAYKISYPTDSR